ncbi:hypothetical protein [uncultured Methanobacterium sp.]|uniref:hypothetical protein n=1 Tax=uncultured Methanobacterium sp. TaxID=176306 RepID=UPI002AA8678B|nr:hypothetical protein [uncultured Methanobacterium sp.]
MGLRLRIVSFWTPEWFQKRGLDELAQQTTRGLEKLLEGQADEDLKSNISLKSSKPSKFNVKRYDMVLKGNLDERRKIMATTHNKLVERMISAMGREEAIKKGRKAMFNEGLSLGVKFKRILGVGNSFDDLFTAARILYDVLGIKFSIKEAEEEGENGKIAMFVSHCTLAEYYTPDTCRVLSAADEGVVQGLNSHVKIKFTKRITEGCFECLAPIKIETISKSNGIKLGD